MVDVELVVQKLSDLAVEVRRSGQQVTLVAPFGTEIQVYQDGDGVQVDVMAFIRGYNTNETGLEDLVRRVRQIVKFCEDNDLAPEKVEL